MIINSVHFIDLLSVRRSRYRLLSNSMSLQLACTKFQQMNATTKRSLKKNASKGSWGMRNFWGEKKAVEVVVIVCMQREDALTRSHPVRVKKTQRNLHIFHPLPTLLTAGLPLTDGGDLAVRLRCEITIWIHARCTERGSGGRRINIQLFHYTWCDFAHHANQMPNLLNNLAICQIFFATTTGIRVLTCISASPVKR